ncbi:unnamed protein product [Closterium sp. Yama58-4]|nr:unnamed protein product [Closterium sp. Yama58-4]
MSFALAFPRYRLPNSFRHFRISVNLNVLPFPAASAPSPAAPPAPPSPLLLSCSFLRAHSLSRARSAASAPPPLSTPHRSPSASHPPHAQHAPLPLTFRAACRALYDSRWVTTRAEFAGDAGDAPREQAECMVVGAGAAGREGRRGGEVTPGEAVAGVATASPAPGPAMASPVDFEACEREQAECVVVGAGAVGLAVARALAVAGREVVVVEAGGAVGGGISSRNSEVIHAGLYYPHGSLKARLCVEGRRQLYAFCEDRGVPHRRVGKLVVATQPCCSIPHAALLNLSSRLFPVESHAEGNGVEGLRMVGREEARGMEPRVECHAALLSLHTGIVDSHALMLALQAEAEAAGALFAFNSAALGIQANPPDRFPLFTTIKTSSPTSNSSSSSNSSCSSSSSTTTSSSSTITLLSSRYLVNAAGLEAVPLAHRARLKREPHMEPQLPPLNPFTRVCSPPNGTASLPPPHLPPPHLPPPHLPPLYLARGHYFAHAGAPPFSRLVYPLPEPGGLGVHATVDLAGRVRFGPDVQWLDSVPLSAAHGMPISYDYSVDPRRAESFYSAIRKYCPTLDDGSLQADYAGIRPKLTAPGEPAADFLIQTHTTHCMPGLIHLLGIESPGLTSCLAIGEYVKQLL